ncbi:uncharacterized protein LOC128667860 [Microplitis demolitor]|uniref:uncharacterized protein LOC128667860 n=1 Tax=Microplitis demolitor TaxID=69319 RepID=UPI00235B69A4|nr:uncharacterized protein LOC128667860 [Microplitis demolitor]
MKDNKTIPLVYILAPRKTKAIYSKFLTVLKNKLQNVQVRRIMVDFEWAYMDAFMDCFPGVEIVGCFFHMTQCVWRQTQQCGLQRRYNNDMDFARHLRMIMALAFVPNDDVKDAYEKLVSWHFYDTNSEELSDLVTYVEQVWIGKRRCVGRRSKPLFAIKPWNCYLAVLQDESRTNNVCEGWHNGLNGRIQVHHAMFGNFIN